jgi:hypothetical protein
MTKSLDQDNPFVDGAPTKVQDAIVSYDSGER